MDIRCNLFKYATSELSHSAFWAWVLDCTQSEECQHKVVSQFGRIFLKEIGISTDIKINNVDREVPDNLIPKNAGNEESKKKIRFDIYVELDDGVIIIENKVSALPSKDQLNYYGQHAKKIMARVILNTGFDYDFCPPDKWIKIGARDIVAMLDKVNYSQHPLLEDYYVWLTSQMAEWDNLASAIESSDYETFKGALSDPIGQWYFMNKIFSCSKAICKGMNLSGQPWTEYWFFKLNEGNELKAFPEALFWRVDFSTMGPYLSLRQYLDTQDTKEKSEEEKHALENIVLKHLDQLRKAFNLGIDRCSAASKDFALTPDCPRNRGKIEREIGWFVIEHNRNTFAQLKTWIPLLNTELTKILADDMKWPKEGFCRAVRNPS